MLQPLNTSGKPKAIKIGHTYPHGVSRQYTSDMRKIIRHLAKQVKEIILPEINNQVEQRDGVRNDSAIEIDPSMLIKRVDRFEEYDDELRFDEYEYDVIRDDIRLDSDGDRMDGLSDILVQIKLLKDNIFPGIALANEYALKTYTANERNISTAIEKSVGVAVNLPQGDLTRVNDWVTNNELLIQDLQEEYLTRIQKSVASGYTTGKTNREIAKDIEKATGITWRRANTIARNEVGNLNAEINQQRSKELGIEKGIWRTMRDTRVRGNPGGLYPKARPSHFANEGKTFELDKGLNGELPGGPINCLPYSSKVNHTPFAEVFYRRWYTGELTEIISDDNVVCRVTPNHPILTDKGFKAAHLINDTDYIVRTFDNISAIVDLYGKDLIPEIGDVFKSLSGEVIGCGVAPASSGNFHGDISNGDIDIVRTDSFLWDAINPSIREKFYQLGFSRPDMMLCRSFFTSFGGFDPALCGPNGTSSSVMSRLNLIFSGFITHLTPLELFGFALGSWCDPSNDKVMPNYAPSNPELFRDCVFAFSCLVYGSDVISRKLSCLIGPKANKLREINSEVMGGFKKIDIISPDTLKDSSKIGVSELRLAKVYKVSTSIFSGHVYNLQTVSGDYSAETTAMSNCRCFYESVIDLD